MKTYRSWSRPYWRVGIDVRANEEDRCVVPGELFVVARGKLLRTTRSAKARVGQSLEDTCMAR
jgi:hypothetical protein